MSDALPFSEEKQLAIFGHFLLDEGFFLQGKGQIDPGYFIDSYVAKAYTVQRAWHKKYNRLPTLDELRHCEAIDTEQQEVRTKILRSIEDAIAATKVFHLDALQPELTDWVRARLVAGRINETVNLIHKQKPEEAYAKLGQLVHKELPEAIFGTDYEVSCDDPYTVLAQELEAQKNPCTFGISSLDRKLLPEGKGGSLLPGDTTIIVAPTNGGKSTTLISIACHNIQRAKKVLLITHEERSASIQQRLWRNLFGCTKEELRSMFETKTFPADKLALLRDNLTFVPYNKAGATVEEVESIIRKKQDAMCARNGGRGYDLVICDYPSKLSTKQMGNVDLQFRHVNAMVYEYFVQLALEFNFHALLAIQTNREGSKKNRGKANDKSGTSMLLGMEDVSESFGPMMVATNVISINRTEKDAAQDRITFYISKSRSNETGWAVVCRSDFARAMTHSTRLGSVYYRSSHSPTERIDQFILSCQHNEIPSDKLLAVTEYEEEVEKK